MIKFIRNFKNKVLCFFFEHKWEVTLYQPLIHQNLQRVTCSCCKKSKSYIGDGSIWLSKDNPKEKIDISIWVTLIDHQREVIAKSLTCKSYDDN